jgi:hypothetical protein
MSRKIVPLLGLGILLACLTLPTVHSQPPPMRKQTPPGKATDEQVQAALKWAVVHLRGQAATLQGGEGALVTMALLKSGLSPDTPEIKAGIDKILGRIVSRICGMRCFKLIAVTSRATA